MTNSLLSTSSFFYDDADILPETNTLTESQLQNILMIFLDEVFLEKRRAPLVAGETLGLSRHLRTEGHHQHVRTCGDPHRDSSVHAS